MEEAAQQWLSRNSTQQWIPRDFDFLADAFLTPYGWLSAFPHVSTIGYVATTIFALLLEPILLYVMLRMMWSLARVGPVRKSMGTFFVVAIFLPLYPLLITLLVSLFWLSLAVLEIAACTLGSFFLFILLWCRLLDFVNDFAEEQAKDREEGVEEGDISCQQLWLSLLVGLLSLCSVGVLANLVAIVKAPVLLIAGLFHASRNFWRGWGDAKSWLDPVRAPITQSDSDSDEEHEKPEEHGCWSWWWFWTPLVFLVWLVYLVFVVCVIPLIILVVVVVILAAAAMWPAYVTSGWLRLSGEGIRRRDNTCGTAIYNGMAASYQVLWASDVLANWFIAGGVKEVVELTDHLCGILNGRSTEVGHRFARASCLPPVKIGIFTDEWDLLAKEIASKLGVSEDFVTETWRALAREMIRHGRDAVERGLITREWVQEVPPELILGLPARVLLDTVERSPQDDELVLSNGFVVRGSDLFKFEGRHGGKGEMTLVKKIWDYLMQARRARAAVELSSTERTSLCAALIAGGGDPEELPQALASALRSFDSLPNARHEACQAILRPLMAVSLEYSKKDTFKEQLWTVVKGINSAELVPFVDFQRGEDSLDSDEV
eukprot:TRINITY_DN20890_c0_g1_i4.p1 TRINITY_DN20890_c0_g1~~TRINITY_DN20890_c0_g1_i4.p1  ORF type:complete len:628 (+),score=87.13 TRINITY_DN20890_c0_g1_i4:77-1885(+)